MKRAKEKRKKKKKKKRKREKYTRTHKNLFSFYQRKSNEEEDRKHH